MGSRMFLLLVLVLLILPNDSQDVPETYEQPLTVRTFTKASAAGEALASPINTPKPPSRLCNCKGKEREMVDAQCLCQRYTRRKSINWMQMCQRPKFKNLKKCSWFKPKKDGNRRIKGPIIPI